MSEELSVKKHMETKIVYFDEAGDDGYPGSSDTFILTSLYLSCSEWYKNFNKIKSARSELHNMYGFYTKQEMHLKEFLTNKNPYYSYHWDSAKRREIFYHYRKIVSEVRACSISVIIDKNNIKNADYGILKNALTYNLQRIENDSKDKWNYLVITDKGRIAPMRKMTRALRAYYPIPSMYENYYYKNIPIINMVEDLLEKDSKESYFIQCCDFIAYCVHLYYRVIVQHKNLSKRISEVIDQNDIEETMEIFKDCGLLNLYANGENKYGLVIYPKK